jgi:hypothetical protein
MMGAKSVLVIGLDPTLIDFSQPGYAPGMDAAKVLVGLSSSEAELTSLGYSAQMCLTDFGETAEAVVRDKLKERRFDCVLIGAGVRVNPSNFILFEKLLNVCTSTHLRRDCVSTQCPAIQRRRCGVGCEVVLGGGSYVIARNQRFEPTRSVFESAMEGVACR